MRKFCLLLILSLALPVFCLLQAVEPPKKEIRAVWLTTVYGLDWPHKPATTEAGRKAQQQALLDILDRLQEANFNMVFIQARLRGDVMYRSAIEPVSKTFSGKYGEIVKVYTVPGYSKEICGGPHAKNTRELVSFKILKEEASSAGVRRIKAVIGAQ